MALHYLIGDATEPVKRPALLPHVCNDKNGWGRGYVLALRAKFPQSEIQYHEWFRTGHPRLGEVQFVQVKPDICIANMIGQHDIRWINGVPPIRYPALEQCLAAVYKKAADEKITVHMPRIGAELSGGEWSKIEEIIKKTMTVDSYVYTLAKQRDKWLTVYE